MPKYFLFILISIFVYLMIPKTALAAWNGLSTAGPDFLSSPNGKDWTFKIGNDGTFFSEGTSVGLAFGAFWCGNSSAASCDSTNSDYTNVSTLQPFTITAPAPGGATSSITKTFTISRADYPCGRVQVDIVPDPNPNGNIIGGHLYDTGKICPPGPPADLSATCSSSGTGTFGWNSDSSVNAVDDLRIDYNPPSWSGNCSNPTDPGKDLCFGPPASPGQVTGMAPGNYDWWIDSCNASGCSNKHASLTCPVALTSISASPISITKTTTWPQLTLAINTNDTTASRVMVCQGSSVDCNGDNGWTDITNNLSPSFLTKDGSSHNYTWTAPSTYTAGSYYFAVYPFGTPKLARSNSVNFTQPALFNFTVSSPINISLVKGSTDPGRSITVTTTKGTGEPITLSLIGSTGGATALFTNNPCNPGTTTCTSTLTFNTSTATPETYTGLVVNGTSTSVPSPGNNSPTFTLTITAPAPTVTLTASPTSIANNASSTLSWTTTNNPTSCTASGDWSGAKLISGGSQSTGSLTGPTNYTYTLKCKSSSGTSLPSTANVSVGGATCPAETNSAFCSRLRKNCDSVTASDNCGTSRTVNCGTTCPSGQTCGGGGIPNVCGGGCTAETDADLCKRLGKDCDRMIAPDNCGDNRTVNCGACSGSQTCNAHVCTNRVPSTGCPWIQTTGGDVHSNTRINITCRP